MTDANPNQASPSPAGGSDIDARIGRFEALIAQDADNDMAHFSLAGAYKQAGRFAEAAASFQRCCELNPAMSKAYQLGGECHLAAGDEDKAIMMLSEGVKVAGGRGDALPLKAMVELLTKLNAPIPETQAPKEALKGDFVCKKTGRAGTKLAHPPFRDGVGTWLVANISKETFDEWIGLGTKIINELRLDLSRDEDEAVYDFAMRRFLGLTDEQITEMRGGAPAPIKADYEQIINDMLGRGGHLEDFKGELHTRVQ